MYSRPLLRTILPVLGLTMALIPAGNAAVSNRIASVATSTRMPLERSVSPRAKRAMDLGAAPSSLRLPAMTMRFNMTDAQQAALSQLLLDQQNPASPRYRQWLTPQQFGAQFGLSASDLSKVSSWLTAQGFTVTGLADSSTFITFSGTAAQVQQALGTTLHSLSLNGEKHIANLTEPVLPAAIASVVTNISGLNDFRPRPHLRRRTVPASAIHPQYTPTPTSTDHFIAPADFYTIYDLNPLLTTSINGTGMTIAVMGQVDIASYVPTDVKAFRTAAGLDVSNLPTTALVGNDPGTPTGSCLSNSPPSNCTSTLSDLEESLLDVEWAGATAPAAKVLFVTSTDVIDTSLVQAIDQNLAPIMTVSYGQCESGYSLAQLSGLNQAFQQANAQGITIFGPTGDDGATDCDSGVSSATQGLAVDFPGSSPYVTGLGGTMFNEGTGTYWNTTNGTTGGSATGYIPETVWNETTLDINANPSSPSFGAGGGGASAFFAKPTWQQGAGVPNDYSRDVPDVSLNAASNHDGYLVCIQGSCANGGFVNSAQSGDATGIAFGGTSVATPSFAGIIALVEQKLGGKGLGNINPNIYALAGSAYYTNIFHDIASGNNNSPCTTGTPNCPNGGSIGYTAVPGYDQASGWGSVSAFNLANDWPLVPPFSTGAASTGSFTLTASSASTTAKAGASAQPITLTLTPASGFTGPISLRASSTQSVPASYTFTAGSNSSVNSVVINSGAAATVTFTLFASQNTQGAARSLRLASSHPPAGRAPWYVAGSGATLACMFLLVLPRRRRWGALLAVILSVGAIGAVGCSSSSGSPNSSTNPAGGSSTGAGTTYPVTVTASTGTGLTQSVTVSLTIQ